MAKKSGSRGKADADVDEVARRMRRDAAPAVARALNLDSAEAVEAAMNAGIELMLAAREVLRAMPMPPEARAHLDRAEAEAWRAARMAAKGVGTARVKKGGKKGATAVKVEFEGPPASGSRKRAP